MAGGKALLPSGQPGLSLAELALIRSGKQKTVFIASEKTYTPIESHLKDSDVTCGKRFSVIPETLSIAKIDHETLLPLKEVSGGNYSDDEAFAPGGHGSFLLEFGSRGILQDWYNEGIRFLSFCNIDNPLGRIPIEFVTYAAFSGLPCITLAVSREPRDCKGGHFCRRVINYRNDVPATRESSERPDGDTEFENYNTYPLFNTNISLVNLAALIEWYQEVEKYGVDLPTLFNVKSTTKGAKVAQLELPLAFVLASVRNDHMPRSPLTSFFGAGLVDLANEMLRPPMGSESVRIVHVDRNFFAPQKTTAGTLKHWSNIYSLDCKNGEMTLDTLYGQDPEVDLDKKYYGDYKSFAERIGLKALDLKGCQTLQIEGNIRFTDREDDTRLQIHGNVTLIGPDDPETIVTFPHDIAVLSNCIYYYDTKLEKWILSS
jgi:hypothetical protein